MSELDIETKLKLYFLVVNRYKDIISEKETKSVTELRNRISPYNEFVKDLKKRLLENVDSEKDFLFAVQRFVAYIKKIKNFEFLFTFWMNFDEINQIGAAPIMDQALLLTSLLRSIEAEDSRVCVTKNNRIYVLFTYQKEKYLVIPETGSLLVGKDIDALFEKDQKSYSFSDLLYENYED